jgi:hypothetical protein
MNAVFQKLILTASAVAALGMATLPAAAQAGELTNRFGDQQARINAGVRDGQLTFREYASTESHLDRVEAQRRWDLAHQDGRLTFAERARLNAELNNNSNRIFFDNHNVARQPGAPLR